MNFKPRRDLYPDPFLPARRLLGSASPLAHLFAAGELGAWLDINNLSLLYTTSAGATNVAAVNDPIGLAGRKAGTNNALNATTTQRPLIKQWPNSGRYYAYHDRVDDKLTLLSMPAGTYTVGFSSFAGVFVYPVVLNTTGTLSLPGADYTELFIVNRGLTDAETSAAQAYLATKTPTISSTDLFRLYSATNSVNLAITETGGSSGATWELGDGQTESGVSCVKTIAAPQSVILRATAPDKITVINWGSKNLFGQIVDLYKLVALTIFYCNSNQLTGSIPSLTANTALTIFYCYGNQLTGSIPSLTANTALTIFQCQTNQLTGSIPSLTANTALTIFYCHANKLTGSIPSLTANTALTIFQCQTNQLTGSIPSLTANTALAIFYCYGNQLTGFSGGTVSATLGDFQAQNNLLSASAVNAILAAFVAANRTTGTRIINLGGTGNAAPTGQGISDAATLVSRGWTVTTN